MTAAMDRSRRTRRESLIPRLGSLGLTVEIKRTPLQERLLRQWKKEHRRFRADWRRRYGDTIPCPLMPPVPMALLDLACGAKTRSGGRCGKRARFPSGRCRYHGAMSTGPLSGGGKEASAEGRRQKGKASDG